MKIKLKYQAMSALLFSLIIIIIQCSNSVEQAHWNKLSEILNQIEEPVFPEMEFKITELGADNQGVIDCSDAFKEAINQCHYRGGGKVIVPPGQYLTGPIHLKSNVNLHIEKGAVLLFSTDIDKYLPPVYTRFEGVECMNFSPLIYANGQENIAITGEGVLDGQAGDEVWWSWAKKDHHGWEEGNASSDKRSGCSFSNG